MRTVPGAVKISNFFPAELVDALIAYLSGSGQRKHTWELGGADTPAVVTRAAQHAAQALDLEFNLAILKWYRTADAYASEAYEVHQDPPRLRSIPLCLFTLKGAADLTYWPESGAPVTVEADANSAVLLQPDLAHRVSAPTNDAGERHLLFLGYDTDVGRR